MRCPLDNETLVMSHRRGVEIDYCPKCRGVWLDRGELDKIVQLSVPVTQGYDARAHVAHSQNPRHKPSKKRKESFLSELFDF